MTQKESAEKKRRLPTLPKDFIPQALFFCSVVGFTIWLDAVTIINRELIIRKGEVGWWLLFCGWETIGLNGAIAFVILKTVNNMVKGSNENVEETTPILKTPEINESKEFLLYEGDEARCMPENEEFVIIFKQGDSPDENVELRFKLRDNTQKIKFSFSIKGSAQEFCWGKQAYLFQIKNSAFRKNFPKIEVNLEESEFKKTKLPEGEYWRLGKTPIFFSLDLKTLLILQNGTLTTKIQFIEDDEKIEGQFRQPKNDETADNSY